MGNEGPRTSDPSRYIRYIYNRVILENATVRASAVSTLAKFGALVDTLKVWELLRLVNAFLYYRLSCVFPAHLGFLYLCLSLGSLFSCNDACLILKMR